MDDRGVIMFEERCITCHIPNCEKLHSKTMFHCFKNIVLFCGPISRHS